MARHGMRIDDLAFCIDDYLNDDRARGTLGPARS
jgi:hypothetical protein